MKTAISSFQTSNMTELLKFHKYVESHLEKLTDETQVCSYEFFCCFEDTTIIHKQSYFINFYVKGARKI